MNQAGAFQSRHWRPLIKFGGWMTVSNLISPIMVNLDRFFIGGFVSIGAIAYYAIPFDMITKVFIVSNSVVTVLFPTFGSLYLVDAQAAVRLYWKGLRTIFLTLSPLLILIGVNASFILRYWLGPDFAIHGAPVLRVLCLGVIVNALAAVPYAYIQGAARPDLTAKFHLAEAPFYLGILWALGTRFGILGVAWGWTIRVLLDLILLLIAAFRIQVSGAPSIRSI
jgi:O-antigen/teichoic acid export membrane protein